MVKFFGQISINDIERATIEHGSDERFDNLLFVIFDFSPVTNFHLQPNEIECIWIHDIGAKHSNSKIKKAVVTRSPEVIALINYYKNLGSAFPIELFATQVDARNWLNAAINS